MPSTFGGDAPVVVLTLVHPDLLPSVYSVAQVLRDRGAPAHIFSFSSPAGGSVDLGRGVTLHDCGPMDGSFIARHRARRRFRATVRSWLREHGRPTALIAACPFSFLEALRVRPSGVPVIFFYYEIYDATPAGMLRSPATAWRTWRAMRRLREAALVCTPSDERAGWLMDRAGLGRRPTTVLNSPYATRLKGIDTPSRRRISELLPGRQVVVYTGGVTASRAVEELVRSVEHWPAGIGLVVTNVGDSDYARGVRDAAATSRRAEDIVLLPLLAREDMLALQARAVVGVSLLRGDCPDTMMPAPNKVGEYLQAGLVVVTTQTTFTSRLADLGVGVIASSISPRDVATAVARAVTIGSDARMRDRITTISREHYSMNVQLRPVLELLGAVDGNIAAL